MKRIQKKWIKRGCCLLAGCTLSVQLVATNRNACAAEQEAGKGQITAVQDCQITTAQTTQQLKLQNPYVNTQGEAVWDCVYFGSYEQYLDGYPNVANKVWEKMPVLWRVLSVSEDRTDVWLMADECLLGCMNMVNVMESDCWAKSMVRSFLNGYDANCNTSAMDFTGCGMIDQIFSKQEQELIKTSTVRNDVGGNTKDKLYLLSTDELRDETYGFLKETDRIAHYTNRCCGSMASDIAFNDTFKNGFWQLRSYRMQEDSLTQLRTDCVSSDGDIFLAGNSTKAAEALRPVLHLDLTKVNSGSYDGLVSYAGQVTNGLFIRKQEKTAVSAVTNPKREEQRSIWDTVTFGKYFKSNAFTKEPVTWRVLSLAADGSEALLMADKLVDTKRFNETIQTAVSWSDCTLRSWLNGYGNRMNKDGVDYQNDSFLSQAFSKEEASCLLDSFCEETGTTDKVRLLTQQECRTSDYGFKPNKIALSLDSTLSYGRFVEASNYARTKGISMHQYDTAAGWMMDKCDPGANTAGYFGKGMASVSGRYAAEDGVGVCPVICVNWKKACETGLVKYQDTIYSRNDDGTTVLQEQMEWGSKISKSKNLSLSGDVNRDGKVSLRDAQMILKYALMIFSVTIDKKLYADVNNDGKVTLPDAQLCLKMALEILPEKLVEESSNLGEEEPTDLGQETKWVYDSENTRHKTMYDGTLVKEEKVSLGEAGYVWGWFDEDAERQMEQQIGFMLAQVSFWQLPVWKESLRAEARFEAASYAFNMMDISSYHLNSGGLPNVPDNRKYITLQDGKGEENAMACFVYDVWQDKKDNSYYGKAWKTYFGTYYASYR